MPIFSLPCVEKFGVMGKCAYEFVDFLVKSKQTYWQILPINETDGELVFEEPDITER